MRAGARTAILLGFLSGACTASRAGAASFAAEFPGRVLAAHNAVRAEAGRAPLQWDVALANGAAAYAEQLAFTGVFAHSNRAARPGIGENLWMGTRGAFSLETMVGNWASEKRMFRPGIFPAVSRTGNWEDVGHYTQIVWPTTTRVGCALASTPRADYLVCRYSPAGNIDGRPVESAQANAAPSGSR
jgi:Cysteine-rich secretory protein family